jgi:hypothetical protein
LKIKSAAPEEPWELPEWIAQALQEDEEVWETFQQFPFFYKRLKAGWIMEAAPSRVEERQKRLNYLIKMTKKGKMYGTIPLTE